MKTRFHQIGARIICALVLTVAAPSIHLFAQVTWTPQTSPTTENLTSVAFGQGVFVAVGESGTLLRSADYGQTWQDRSNEDLTLGELHCVAFGNGVFMAGAGYEVVVSTDLGVTWHQATPTLEWRPGLAYGNNRWFAASDSISASLNQGTNWTLIDTNKPELTSILFNGNVGVAVGGTIAVSEDGGLHWTDVVNGLFNWQASVAYGNGLYVSVGGTFGNGIVQTSDPLTWTEAGSTNLTGVSLLAVTHGGDTFVVVGDKGVILNSNGQKPWTRVVSDTSQMLRDVAYGNGTFVAVGHNGTILTSLTSGQAPEINSSLTATGSVDVSFSYTITALYGPVGFDALDLPPGLTINTSTGIISGIPTQVGQFNSTITVDNAYGTDSKTLVITIGSGGGSGFQVKIYTAVELEFNTRVGHDYQVESSSNLTDWSDYGDPIPGDGQTQYRLYSTRDQNHRFYRVREQ
jgi:photosystem II stability/assembly factor-like uncharacterized protein